MFSRYAVRGCAIVVGAVIFTCAASNAHAQDMSASRRTWAATGEYANMPGQPGSPPTYMNRARASDLPETVVIQAPVEQVASADTGSSNFKSSTPPAADEIPVAPPPAREPPPPQTINYHTPSKEQPESRTANDVLATRRGIDLGLQVSDYRYREPGSSNTKISGVNYGGLLGVTGVVGDHFFGTVEGRYAKGWMDYSGTGSTHNRPNDLWEARGLVGKDFIFTYFSMSPFAGIGFRRDDSDLRGTSSTGTNLYERENETFYVPMGIRPRFRLGDDSMVASSFEYDLPLQSIQISHLGDVGNGDPVVRNNERNGYGFRGEIMYQTRWFALGPFANYWSFDTSRTSVYRSPSSSCGSTNCSFTQPSSHTVEAGLQLKVHLF